MAEQGEGAEEREPEEKQEPTKVSFGRAQVGVDPKIRSGEEQGDDRAAHPREALADEEDDAGAGGAEEQIGLEELQLEEVLVPAVAIASSARHALPVLARKTRAAWPAAGRRQQRQQQQEQQKSDETFEHERAMLASRLA